MNSLPEDDFEDEAKEQRRAARALVTSTAKLARLGATVHELKSGGYLVSAGGHIRTFNDVETLAKFVASLDSRA